MNHSQTLWAKWNASWWLLKKKKKKKGTCSFISCWRSRSLSCSCLARSSFSSSSCFLALATWYWAWLSKSEHCLHSQNTTIFQIMLQKTPNTAPPPQKKKLIKLKTDRSTAKSSHSISNWSFYSWVCMMSVGTRSTPQPHKPAVLWGAANQKTGVQKEAKTICGWTKRLHWPRISIN